MALSALDDRAHAPTQAELAGALGSALVLWKDLEAGLEQDLGPLSAKWSFSGEKYGWSLRLLRGKRTVIYLIPRAGAFLAGLVLGEKAVRAALESEPPGAVARTIETAPCYAEGRGFRLEVRSRKDLMPIRRLVALKMER